MDSWSELNRGRLATRARWKRIWNLPRIARSTRYAAARIQPGQRVLDIGASEGAFGRKLADGVVYKTIDSDPKVDPDYRFRSRLWDKYHPPEGAKVSAWRTGRI